MDALRSSTRDDATDGWVSSTMGRLPLAFALPVVLGTGAVCVFAGLAGLFRGPLWRAVVVLTMGSCFLWLARQLWGGWRNRP